ncbi:WD repeat protein [Schizosaccharomyces cryophilus OY26]|uniref:WD repeat protein n=1 Tax=Schizosaccharomyces cryophilus (strain OY26 / ATCC MYA-4695 / CBS 11777 / NBRC 106824 / NRRL Y48691) TaxID=653667 RepID=S9VXV7_SCHCR|nr:WD repeat protein [Schizosaccharomyces cryophilus OY26]EPY52423.1 WD repeat protein [Schizosaccharomyces cryophilus OY26]
MAPVVLYCSWNQDQSCLSIGTETGFQIYQCDPFTLRFSKETHGVAFCEMLNRSSLIALVQVSPASTRLLKLIDIKKDVELCRMFYPAPVLNIRLTTTRLVVVIKGSIYVYNLKNLNLINTLATIPSNKIAFSAHESFIAYNSPQAPGYVYLTSLETAMPITLLHCHSSPVRCIEFHPDGHLIATASAKGTVIRIMSTSTGEKAMELRRGYIPASVVSIAFHSKKPFLACASENGTIHIYKLSKQNFSETTHSPTSSMSNSSSWSKFLKSNVTKPLEARREFATAKIPEASFCGKIIFSASKPHVQVISYTGQYYRFVVDFKHGGNCAMLERYILDE